MLAVSGLSLGDVTMPKLEEEFGGKAGSRNFPFPGVLEEWRRNGTTK